MSEAPQLALSSALPHCDYCDEPVGVYEPLWLEAENGRVRLASVRSLEESDLARRMWHSGCLGRATVHVLQ